MTKWLLVALAVFGLPILLWVLALALTRWLHTFPPCSSCQRTDRYRWIKPEMFGWEQGRIFRYHCGFCPMAGTGSLIATRKFPPHC